MTVLKNQNASNKMPPESEKMSVQHVHEMACHNSASERDKETPVLVVVKWQRMIVVNTSVSEPHVNDLFQDNIVSAGMNLLVEADAGLDAYKVGSLDCCSFVIGKLVLQRPAARNHVAGDFLVQFQAALAVGTLAEE